MTRTATQSFGWRGVCVCLTVSIGPVLLTSAAMGQYVKASVAGMIALVGLAGYSFGFRLGPVLFWRVFAVIFSVELMMRMGRRSSSFLASLVGSVESTHPPIVLALALALCVAVCVALFRHAELIGGGRKDPHAELEEIFS